MNTRRVSCVALAVLAALAMASQLLAQETAKLTHPQPRYKLIVLRTLGGGWGAVSTGPPLLKILNNHGTFVANADTTTPDPYAPFCLSPDCLIAPAIEWKNGVEIDRGALPGTNGSGPAGVNERGVIAGFSEKGSIDPATNAPEYDAVVWKDGSINDLGTFGGKDSFAYAINDRDQVVGWALNSIPDNYTYGLGPCTTLDCFPVTTQIRAFLWQDGRKDDLGTLGGDDASANLINDLGMVGGESYTDTTPNPSTGVPTQDPFLWVDGKMLDLGTLGGTYGYPNWLNFWGQVVGQSNLAGDKSFHPFLWEAGAMHDLGTFGGATGSAWWINDAGEIAGYADLPTSPTGCSRLTCVHHAFLWRRGVKTDLGTVGTDLCSRAFSINLYGHLVGESASVCGGNNTRAALWRDGVAYDLNALIPPGSDLTLQTAWDINDRDEIAGDAVLSNGEERAFLLIPCDGDDPGGCTNEVESIAIDIEATERVHRNSASMKERQSAARAVNPYSNQIGSHH